MRTVSLTDFVDMMDEGTLVWPPVFFGGHIYSRRNEPDVDNPSPTLEVVRAAVP